MQPKFIGRPWPLILVFLLAAFAWTVLGGIMENRTSQQGYALEGRVHDLWGAPHIQSAPRVIHHWNTTEQVRRPLVDSEGSPVLDGRGKPVVEEVEEVQRHHVDLLLSRTRVDVDLGLDQRRKGLMWFPLYDVDFSGHWTVESPGGPGWIEFVFPFPDPNAVYDDFSFGLGESDVTQVVEPRDGMVSHRIPMPAEGPVAFSVGYNSRGMGTWKYRPLMDVGRLADFQVDMSTDFSDIDFPAYTLSPSDRVREGEGWKLSWHFSNVVTGHGIGMVMPQRVQPGPLVARMSFSAPISLGLFMIWIYALGVVKGIRVHWMNHLFLAAAFFSFHLLFGYTADHLPVEWAFGLSSVVSVFLVVSYLRLVVDSRFAFVEAGLAQLLYLVGFSLAHFWAGFTGLTITILGVLTLFALMQLTGGIRWGEVMAKPAPPRPQPGD